MYFTNLKKNIYNLKKGLKISKKIMSDNIFLDFFSSESEQSVFLIKCSVLFLFSDIFWFSSSPSAKNKM